MTAFDFTAFGPRGSSIPFVWISQRFHAAWRLSTRCLTPWLSARCPSRRPPFFTKVKASGLPVAPRSLAWRVVRRCVNSPPEAYSDGEMAPMAIGGYYGEISQAQAARNSRAREFVSGHWKVMGRSARAISPS